MISKYPVVVVHQSCTLL